MYENVKKILDKSRETGEDILVSRDMCIAEDKENAENLKGAFKLIDKHYDIITKCRRENDDASIERLCDLIAKGDSEELKAFEKEIKER